MNGVDVRHEVGTCATNRVTGQRSQKLKVRTSSIGLLVVCGIGVCSISTAAAPPAGPPAGYNINAEFTEKSPDWQIPFRNTGLSAKRREASSISVSIRSLRRS